MMLARLEEMHRQYSVSSDAANAIWHALMRAEGDELCETWFDETPKLKEIVDLRKKIEDANQRLTGARDALSSLLSEMKYQRDRLETIGQFTKWRWDRAVNFALIESQSA